MQKKAMTLNITITLVMVLIILSILLYMIMGGTENLVKTSSCENTGGRCVSPDNCDGEQSFIKGCQKEQICCIQG